MNIFASSLLGALILLAAAGSSEIARAGTVGFTGTRYESLPAAVVSGPCYPAATTLYVNNTIGIATGTSNFGSFSVDMVACLHTPFPAPITDGTFTWTFDDGDTLSGTWSGLDTRVNLASGGHLLTINESYVVTGGTGEFASAVGNIDETGTAVSTGTSAIANYTLAGTISGPNVTATPEPDALVLAGTGLIAVLPIARRRLWQDGR